MKNQQSQLFLSEIAKKDLNIDCTNHIDKIYSWFKTKLIIVYPNTVYGGLNSIEKDKDLSKLYKKYLNFLTYEHGIYAEKIDSILWNKALKTREFQKYINYEKF